MTTIAVDCMGGDHGPAVTLVACRNFLLHYPDAKLLLVGLPDQLTGLVDPRVRVVAASEVVGMDEPPADALRKKKDSSMRVAINLVRDGEAHGCVSAGNTGALMGIARFVLKTLPGIDRPAIARKWARFSQRVRPLAGQTEKGRAGGVAACAWAGASCRTNERRD